MRSVSPLWLIKVIPLLVVQSMSPFFMLLDRDIARLRGYVPLTGLFRGDFVLIVVEVLPAEQETKLWVVLLLVLSHLLKFWSVASDKLCQLVYDVP